MTWVGMGKIEAIPEATAEVAEATGTTGAALAEAIAEVGMATTEETTPVAEATDD